MRHDLIDLQLILAIAETGSITAGAARSHLSLPAASARVRAMETAIGEPLFMRNSRGVHPTRACETVLHHARIVILELEQLDSEIAGIQDGRKGRVRLLCNTSALSEFLPEALGAFLARHPDVDVDVEERMSYDIVKAVRDGHADIGIVTDSVNLSGLETRPFRLDRLVVAAARGWLDEAAGADAAVAFSALLDQNFVGLTADSALQRYLALHAKQCGRTMKLRARVRSFDAVCHLVHAGVGIAVIPETAAMRYGAEHRLGWRALSDAWATRRLTLCMRSYELLPRYARALVSAVEGNGRGAPGA